MEPDKQLAAAASDYKKWFFARTRLVEGVLRMHEYVSADRFTMADISVGYAFMLSNSLGYFDELSPTLKNYWLHLQQRAGFQRALQVQQIESERQLAADAPDQAASGITSIGESAS